MTQQMVKTNLFESLLSEQKNSVRHQICDTISEIGSSMIQEKGGKEQWTDLVSNVFKLIQTGQINNIESGLIIISGMLAYNIDDFLPYKNQLLEICKMGLDHNDHTIKLAAVECVGSYVESAEPKESKSFEALLLNVFNAIWVLMEKDETVGQQALQVLVDLAETEPKFFKAHFKETFTLMHKIVFNKSITDEGIKKIATEIMITIGERIPKLYKDNQQQLQQLLEMIFMHMIDIDQEITQEWNSPEEGYNDDIQEDADLEVVRFGMSAVDRLISAIGQKVLLPILSNIV